MQICRPAFVLELQQIALGKHSSVEPIALNLVYADSWRSLFRPRRSPGREKPTAKVGGPQLRAASPEGIGQPNLDDRSAVQFQNNVCPGPIEHAVTVGWRELDAVAGRFSGVSVSALPSNCTHAGQHRISEMRRSVRVTSLASRARPGHYALVRGPGIAIFLAGLALGACTGGAASTSGSSVSPSNTLSSSAPSAAQSLESCETLLSLDRALFDLYRAPFDNEEASLATLNAAAPPDEISVEWHALLTQAATAVSSQVELGNVGDKSTQGALRRDVQTIDAFITDHVCEAPAGTDYGCPSLDECAALIMSGDINDHEASPTLVEFSHAIAAQPGWQLLLGHCDDMPLPGDDLPLPSHVRSICSLEQHDGDRILARLIVRFVYTSSSRFIAWTGQL